MVNIDLFYLDENFWALLPAHRKLINDLLIEGRIEMYAISEDKAQGWIIIKANHDREVKKIVDGFPIRNYFRYEIHPLFILNNSVSLWPKMHLN